MSRPRTLASLPLPEVLWRLASHVPGILHMTTRGIQRVHALGIGVDAWPDQRHHPALVSGSSAQFDALAMSLLSHTAQKGLTPKLEFWDNWRCELFLHTHGWLRGTGIDESAPLLHAVAGACLLAFEIQAGRTGWLE
ncbi:hypothetical protein MF271_19085 (plasmid) [Deinococcus sp. KNUC1210]|uniref:hypothetical protein n=1 Tax=Deinococcus sp. KNUC1210 TaxID=2917691 RepID=UPI001EEFED5F|nr:hypothetical protein [Deinococcus sp. KNUC1210]ULH17426.1 hypothetical protein MF271_19085 [Deinococcus sp. KNUC1210]